MDQVMRLLPLIAAVVYVLAARRARRWSLVRTVVFVAGVVIVVVATTGPLDRAAHELLSAHMWQHLLLTLVAAPLLVWGAPVTLVLRVWSKGRPAVARILHSLPARALSHPVVTWTVFAVAMWGTHFTGFYAAALESAPLHLVEHVLYLVAAALFWFPVIGVDPARRKLSRPGRVGYLIAALPFQSFLGVAIYSSGRVLYEPYGTGAAALSDQRTAGMIMWLAGDALLLIAVVVCIVAWLRHEAKDQMRMA